MKYEKRTFTITPNKEHLRGKPPEMLAVYFWICDRADEQGLCFPSRAKIADDCGIKSVRTIDKYIKELVDMGILVKTVRKTPGEMENTSNLYQIMLLDAPPRAINAPPSASIVPITIPINYTQLSKEDPPPLIEKSKEDMKLTTRTEKEKLIGGIYAQWIKMASTFLEIDEKDVDRSTLMRVISSAVKREETWTIEDFKSLFKYFFNDEKMAFEKKLSYALCLSATYISQYKLSKKVKKKSVGSFADVSDGIRL